MTSLDVSCFPPNSNTPVASSCSLGGAFTVGCPASLVLTEKHVSLAALRLRRLGRRAGLAEEEHRCNSGSGRGQLMELACACVSCASMCVCVCLQIQ